MGAHTTSDDPTKYRSDEEVEAWREKDPIQRLRAYLDHEGLADAGFYAGVDKEADELAAQIRSACLALPDPEPATMFDHVYADAHAQISEERAFLADYLAGFDGQEG
jgi:pyruvate dehydrogenase E1 component alpha subunit